jgi:hypothetical protein
MNRREFLRVSTIAAVGAAALPLTFYTPDLFATATIPEKARLALWPHIALDILLPTGERTENEWLTDPKDWALSFTGERIRITHAKPLDFAAVEACVVYGARITNPTGALLHRIVSMREYHLINGDTFCLQNIVLTLD